MSEIPATQSSLHDWFSSVRPQYGQLVDTLVVLLKVLLHAERIPFIDVQGRVKTEVSFSEKVRVKKYSDPATQITDIAGLRIITLVESDIRRAESLIGRTFRVHADDSVDKSNNLGVDRVGYRSIHIICELGPDRTPLPEFSVFAGLKFEVQIRTSLQHAWAEIEHDRGYKLKGELPSHLKRKFSLLAGLLELADSQFDELTAAIEKYSSEISAKTVAEYSGIELNSSSMRIYLASKFGEHLREPSTGAAWPKLIEEVRAFGIKDLQEFDSLVTEDVRARVIKNNPGLPIAGLVRDVLMFNDLQRYFERSWNGNWSGMDEDTYAALTDIYGVEVVRDETNARHIDIIDNEPLVASIFDDE
jgi:ppGpp synthetase/RelA/SpoT-type nucleotidyltranferase